MYVTMKLFILLPFIALAGCASQPSESDSDYRTDLAVVAQFHKYACPECAARHHRSREGFSKENTSRRVSVSSPSTGSGRVTPVSSPRPAQPFDKAQGRPPQA